MCTWVQVSAELEDGVRSSGDGFADNCELPDVGPNTGPLREQSTEPSLQP